MQQLARHLTIRGRVQGVAYRWSMVQEAERLGVNGWVRNRGDGSVEAIVTGNASAVQALIDWARHGPAGARVDAVEVTPAPAESGLPGFEQRPSA